MSVARSHSWRGFSNDALATAISSDLAASGWVNDPTARCEEPGDFVQYAGNALLRSLFKKWGSTSVPAESRALLTFLEANHLSRRWAKPHEFEFSGRFNTIWERVKWELDKLLHPGGVPLITSYKELWESGYTGPGASIAADGTSFYAKFGSSELSASSEELYLMYSLYTLEHPRWAGSERTRCSTHGRLSVVDTSNVSFAPKNADTARLICTEPSINMFLQLGVKEILEKELLKQWGLDMEDQPDINRLLAKLGSTTGAFGTLDLASASDRLSLELCRQLLPTWFFELLSDLRSKATLVREYGLRVDLGMLSTMGNGFTFPVMTMILGCVVRAVYYELGIPIQDNRRYVDRHGNVVTAHANWAVFGDDIIVKREAYDLVTEILQLCGFAVNVTKSFNQGPFRESCGHDYYHGLNVRGVYLEKMTSLQDLTVAVNRLVGWTAQTGISLKAGCAYLMGLYRDSWVPYVPYSFPDSSGIRVPFNLVPENIRRTRKGMRWVGRLCFRAWAARPEKVVFGDGTVKVSSGRRRLGYNADALVLSLLLGEVRNGEIHVRQNDVVSYRTQWHEIPNWDYVPPSVWFNHQTDWRRFESAVYSCLFD